VASNRDLVRKDTCTERGVHSVVASGRSNYHATSPQESLSPIILSHWCCYSGHSPAEVCSVLAQQLTANWVFVDALNAWSQRHRVFDITVGQRGGGSVANYLVPVTLWQVAEKLLRVLELLYVGVL